MTIKRDQLPHADQIKLSLLSKADQADVLNCKNVEQAKKLISEKKQSVRLKAGTYEPKIQISGSSVRYKTKNVFTEIFEEQDVLDFMKIVDLSTVSAPEIAIGELKRKAEIMDRDGMAPLQCLVYATKHNEKIFYNNGRTVTAWAEEIAEQVNNNEDYVSSINHMLVNWGMWRNQIRLLIEACSYIRINEKLDEVIRDLYSEHEDDDVRYTVIKRMVHGLSYENFKCAFKMIRNADYSNRDSYRKYFNVIKHKVMNAVSEEYDMLYSAFRETQGIGGGKRKQIAQLFGDVGPEPEILTKINKSDPDQKDIVLKEVHSKIYGSKKDYIEFARLSRDIIRYRKEIQTMYINKVKKTYTSIEDLKLYGLAILDLDEDGTAIPFFEEQLSECHDRIKEIIFAYLLATASDSFINRFIYYILRYSGGSINILMNSVRYINRQGASQVVRKELYNNCVAIIDETGRDSRDTNVALHNLAAFLQDGNSTSIYDTRFDQLLFEYIGYDKVSGVFDDSICDSNKALKVLNVLETVMNDKNYKGRYMRFMQNLFNYFKTSNKNICDRINASVAKFPDNGIPQGFLGGNEYIDEDA